MKRYLSLIYFSQTLYLNEREAEVLGLLPCNWGRITLAERMRVTVSPRMVSGPLKGGWGDHQRVGGSYPIALLPNSSATGHGSCFQCLRVREGIREVLGSLLSRTVPGVTHQIQTLIYWWAPGTFIAGDLTN